MKTVYSLYSNDYLLNKMEWEDAPYAKNADIILFEGGIQDIHPHYYKEGFKGARNTGAYPQVRTNLEIELYDKYKESKQFIGICRGHQLLNVLNGGNLIQHIDGHGGCHHYVKDEETKLIGSVNSMHHQCIGKTSGKVLAKSYTPFFKSPDNIIEAVKWDTGAGALGVQWHPEYADENEFSFTYFKELVEKYLK